MKRVDQKHGNGTSLVGYLNITYDELVEKFGKSDGKSSDNKCKAQWCFSHNGTIITIYDWKMYTTPLRDITDWHIGGHSKKAVEILRIQGFDAVNDN